MARALSSRAAATLSRRLGARPAAAVARRANHTRRPGAGGAMVLELDAAGASPAAAEGAGALKRRLEEAIDGAMARMSEPEWAPFRPGTSYYAPPRPAGAALGLLELVTRGGGIGVLPPPLSDDEARAVASSSRGYPCSAYFVDGRFPDEEVEGLVEDADLAEED
ncbi:uncharacterized protein LOC125519992 [Triticum urartu]|uniref:Uncharacterized protein n=2 Tax=Triticum TaxID=4564 RepID=A0A3B6RR32_WHEAT|nr:uncharacterized protein LOC119330779 [Triticum dicoccoides]XP_044424885.1 uncharacterized protein LOC123149317 [Triticum aestivum]XP_048540729.1 uncharacterized protein LOC125519992 [Triticum urartu]